MSVVTLPSRVKGCDVCAILERNARTARGDAANRRRVLSRHPDDGLTGRYVEEYREFSARAEKESTTYLAHHAETHPISSVVLPGTDNDRAPSHRKPAVPPAADLAARLRAGETIEALAAEYERTPAVLGRKISMAGFHSRTGEPRHARRDQDGLPVPLREWSFPAWVDEALCAEVGGEPWFPEKNADGHAFDNTIQEAKAVCAVCPVRVQCLDYALTNNERFGIWGGLSERERRKAKKEAS